MRSRGVRGLGVDGNLFLLVYCMEFNEPVLYLTLSQIDGNNKNKTSIFKTYFLFALTVFFLLLFFLGRRTVAGRT